MDFSLSSSLVGSATLNPDKLSLNLQFAADKTLTARKGPTPTFTRASTARFVGSDGLIQSAAINTPRFDHDPVTFASKGLLIEESRTNLFLQSEDFATTWGAINSTVSVNVATSPSGLVTADKLIVNSGSTAGRISVTTTLTGAHTMSVFLKESEWGWVFITPSAAIGGVWFNLSNGTIGTQQAGCVGSIVSYGNGWYRCSVTLTGTGSLSTSRIVPTNADNTNTAGDGTSGILAWGAQLEAGAFPTSYIPTTTASVVRSADVCSITGSAFTSFYNNAAGTFVSEAMIANLTGNNRGIAQIDSGVLDNIIRHNYALSDGGFTANLRANLDTPTTFAVSAGAASVIQKRAIAYEGTSFASAINGGSVGTVTRTFPVGLNTLRIGSLTSGGFLLNGHIAAVRFYKKRLSNAKLQAITT